MVLLGELQLELKVDRIFGWIRTQVRLGFVMEKDENVENDEI